MVAVSLKKKISKSSSFSLLVLNNSNVPLVLFFFFKQKTAYDIGLGIPAEPLFRSLVMVRTKEGLRFTSEQLFWDESRHELYSYVFSRLVTPERTLQGSFFRSDERMTHYLVTNSRGSFQSTDFGGSTAGSDSAKAAQDSALMNQRQKATPVRTVNE